jgi:hypothetical protein
MAMSLTMNRNYWKSGFVFGNVSDTMAAIACGLGRLGEKRLD